MRNRRFGCVSIRDCIIDCERLPGLMNLFVMLLVKLRDGRLLARRVRRTRTRKSRRNSGLSLHGCLFVHFCSLVFSRLVEVKVVFCIAVTLLLARA